MEKFNMYIDKDKVIQSIDVSSVDDLFTRIIEESASNDMCDIFVETPRYRVFFSKGGGFKVETR